MAANIGDKLPISVQELKDRYFFGTIQILKDVTGRPPDDNFFEFYIRAATRQIESDLDLTLVPTDFEERFPYWPPDFQQYAYLSLNHTPLRSIKRIAIRWPTDDTNLVEFPATWYSFKKGSVLGRVQIVPHQNMLGSVMIYQGGTFLPLLQARGGYIPDLFHVEYSAGFDSIPEDILNAIGLMASIGPFDNAGDIIGGAGIASKSVSIPGISMSVSTTSSATSAGFGSRIISYREALKKLMPTLKNRYGRTMQMMVV